MEAIKKVTVKRINIKNRLIHIGDDIEMNIGLQLYTVRDETEKDFLGTLEKLSKIGYDGVEFAGFGDITAVKMKNKLDELGLQVAGSHTAYELLENELDQVITYNKIIGNTDIVIPYYEFEEKQDYLDLASKLDKLGDRLAEDGMRLSYHNHYHEFKKYNGQYGLDILLNNVNHNHVKFQIDICWVHAAGVDPVGYLKKYKQCTPLVHIKDIKDIANKELTEVGNGQVDVKKVVDTTTELATEWLIIEQDRCKRPSIESAEISFKNLKNML